MASKVTLNGELMFPNEYISALELKGKDVALTITSVTAEQLKTRNGKDKKGLVVRFRGTTKKLVCNKTNADSIATLHGSKADSWPGKRVTLYPTRCLAFGEQVDCIRIRDKNNGPTTARQLPDPPPPDTFDEPPNNAPDAGDDPTPVDSSSESGESSGAGADIGEHDDQQQPEPPPDESQDAPATLPDPCSEKQIKNLLMLQAPEGMDSNTAITVIDAFFKTKLPKKWEDIQRAMQIKYFNKWMGGEFPPFNAM